MFSVDESIILLRIRSRNWYSFAPLVASLKVSGFPDFLMVKNTSTDITSNIYNIKKKPVVFYLDSYKTMDRGSVEKELLASRDLLKRKKEEQKLYFIAGGPHPTGDPVSALNAGFDYVIRGEGEKALPSLLKALLQQEHLAGVPAVSYITENNQIVHNKPGKPVNLDDYSPYVNLSSVKLHPPIEIMRGCHFKCRFCQVPRLYSKVRFRSLESIDGIFAHYAEVFKNQPSIDLRFVAPNFLGYGSASATVPNVDKLWKIVEMAEKHGARLFMGSFPSEVRPESITNDTIEILKHSSSKNVAIGAQSGSERMLKTMRRGHGAEEVYNACNMLVKNGFIPLVDFILGLPGETPADMAKTLEMMGKLVRMGCKIRGHHFLPLPGTPWENERPTEIPVEISVEIGRLAKQQRATGCFERQKASVQNEIGR